MTNLISREKAKELKQEADHIVVELQKLSNGNSFEHQSMALQVMICRRLDDLTAFLKAGGSGNQQ